MAEPEESAQRQQYSPIGSRNLSPSKQSSSNDCFAISQSDTIKDSLDLNTCRSEHDQEQAQQNDSSTLSTAFTISFDDDSNTSKKLFGIRDSIRKFAPPKPNTIEKPRQSKNDCQDSSYMSIESAPGGIVRPSFRRSDSYSSCRSSGKKSNSSRHSNISESAAFLIGRMLNCNKQGEILSSIGLNDEDTDKPRMNITKHSTSNRIVQDNEDILDDEIDFCEEKSDNGTYVVGADPETDAARKKMDELFGVVKAAEASLLASSALARRNTKPIATVGRQSRTMDKKPISRERQDHINRLAIGRNSSRSSSSSRQEISSTGNRAQSATRGSRNSSCERSAGVSSSRPRRAASQTSRNSSNRENSDGDTRSSRSSLHNEVATINTDTQPANNLGMKFNRAFTLRRARLGLGEPASSASRQAPIMSSNGQEYDSLNMSPRRYMSATYKHGNQSQTSSNNQTNLNRSDGGRFSLRMRKNFVPSKYTNAMQSLCRSSQPSPQIENYLNKVPIPKMPTSCFVQANMHQTNAHPSINMPCQSGDDIECLNNTFKLKNIRPKSNRSLHRKDLSDTDGDVESHDHSNFSMSAVVQGIFGTVDTVSNRASASRQGGSAQLGALDCLVISAINTLSVKIRGSVCDLMVEHAKKLPIGNETRLVVEEILPQLTANSVRPRSPTSIEEIDQSLHFDLAQTLKNLKKVEQMVDVMKLISSQSNSSTISSTHNTNSTDSKSSSSHNTNKEAEDAGSNTNSEINSLSPV